MEKLHSVTTTTKPKELVKTQTNTKMILSLLGLGLVGLSLVPNTVEEDKEEELTAYQKEFYFEVSYTNTTKSINWCRHSTKRSASIFNISIIEDGLLRIDNFAMGAIKFHPKEIDHPDIIDLIANILDLKRPGCTNTSSEKETETSFTNEVAEDLLNYCKEYIKNAHKHIIRPTIHLGINKSIITLKWHVNSHVSTFIIDKYNGKWQMLKLGSNSPELKLEQIPDHVFSHTLLPKQYSKIQAAQIIDLLNALNSTEVQDQNHLDKIVNTLTGNDSDANLETATTDPY